MSAAEAEEILIAPPRRWSGPRLRELWRARELMYFIFKRELQIRYRQSFFGVLWVVVQPLALAGVFSIFIGSLANVGSDGVPYPLFALAGLGAWLFVSNAVGAAATSLVGDQNLVSKVYFPRLTIPLGRMLALTVDVVIALLVVILATFAYGRGLPTQVLLLPGFLLLAFLTAAGVGIFLAALNVKYRDVGMAVPLTVQLWLFITPVLYPGTLVTGAWQYLYAVNPMTSAVQGTRWALLGTPPPGVAELAISTAVAVGVLVAGTLYFRRTEHFFADII